MQYDYYIISFYFQDLKLLKLRTFLSRLKYIANIYRFFLRDEGKYESFLLFIIILWDWDAQIVGENPSSFSSVKYVSFYTVSLLRRIFIFYGVTNQPRIASFLFSRFLLSPFSLSIGICAGFMNENSACTCTLFYGAEIVSNTSRQQHRIISTKWQFQTDSILRGRNNALFQHLQHGILRLMCTRNRDVITTIRWLFSQFPQVSHTNF